MDSST
jgi:hypothetical protein